MPPTISKIDRRSRCGRRSCRKLLAETRSPYRAAHRCSRPVTRARCVCATTTCRAIAKMRRQSSATTTGERDFLAPEVTRGGRPVGRPCPAADRPAGGHPGPRRASGVGDPRGCVSARDVRVVSFQIRQVLQIPGSHRGRSRRPVARTRDRCGWQIRKFWRIWRTCGPARAGECFNLRSVFHAATMARSLGGRHAAFVRRSCRKTSTAYESESLDEARDHAAQQATCTKNETAVFDSATTSISTSVFGMIFSHSAQGLPTLGLPYLVQCRRSGSRPWRTRSWASSVSVIAAPHIFIRRAGGLRL